MIRIRKFSSGCIISELRYSAVQSRYSEKFQINFSTLFFIFTSENKVPVKLKVNESADYATFNLTTKFDSGKPTKILIHGWKNR